MRVAIFGITGRIGRRVAREALSRGHEVTGVSRDPARVDLKDPKLRVTRGDATDAASVAAAAAGHDVVVSAIGPAPDEEVGTLLIDAAHALIDGVKRARAGRLIVVGGAGSLEVAPGVKLMDAPGFPKEWKAVAAAAADALDIYRKEKQVDWTYLSPAALIEPGNRTGSYRTGLENLVSDSQGNSRISMEDFAVALVDEVEKPRHSRLRFTVAY